MIGPWGAASRGGAAESIEAFQKEVCTPEVYFGVAVWRSIVAEDLQGPHYSHPCEPGAAEHRVSLLGVALIPAGPSLES